MLINTFTKNLKKKRKEKGFTQRQLADILDVTLKTYRSWETCPYPKH
ncbi:MAG: helix-turn-helix domain-containing protein [Blautia massiliensis (ex Durand et al. 2017)]